MRTDFKRFARSVIFAAVSVFFLGDCAVVLGGCAMKEAGPDIGQLPVQQYRVDEASTKQARTVAATAPTAEEILVMGMIPTLISHQGCTDPNANNYDPYANVDNGTCTYTVYGCTDPTANNYDPSANYDNGSCTYDTYGCTDPNATNYDPSANEDDGSCTY